MLREYKINQTTMWDFSHKESIFFKCVWNLHCIVQLLIPFFPFYSRRGKPLYICKERYKVLEQQWISHTFDHINKRWGPHYNGLWLTTSALHYIIFIKNLSTISFTLIWGINAFAEGEKENIYYKAFPKLGAW